MNTKSQNSKKIQTFRELRVYQNSIELAGEIFELTKSFPKKEQYSLTDQIRRSSRSMCANIGEAWHKRAYEKAFLAKLNDSLSEAAETQVWLELALNSDYISNTTFETLFGDCDTIISQLIKMSKNPDKWVVSQ